MDLIVEVDEVLEKFSPFADRRPFEVILRGGGPWGFKFSGGEGEGNFLHVSEIEKGSKADNSALLVGDTVLCVNGISCRSLAAAGQLVDSAFRTVTLTVIRGGWDGNRSGRLPSTVLRAQELRQRERNVRHSHDDSALYAQSKASEKSRVTMKPSRRRGDSFNVGKPKNLPGTSTSDQPASWTGNRLTSRDQNSPTGRPRPSYPGTSDFQNSAADRSSGSRHTFHTRVEGQHMIAAKSSPNLNNESIKDWRGVKDKESASTPSVKSVKSSPNIPEDVERENQIGMQKASMFGSKHLPRTSVDYGKGSDWGRGDDRRTDHMDRSSKRYSEDMYTADMTGSSERQMVTPHSLHKYQPDYENLALLGTASLQSERISEIDDIEDEQEPEAPKVPPRPSYDGSEHCNPFRPTPPIRDPSSLKYIRVNQNHEKYPSWPVTQANAVSDQSQPINVRAQSLTDHTDTNREFPSKQQLAYTPGLRPLPEKNSPTAERKGDDSSKSRNTSDPGFKSEFVYDKYGRVLQRRNDDATRDKGRFEEFYQNSKPGYPPPKLDSDGHNFGDKEYSAPSPPERDHAGVDLNVLSQALNTGKVPSFPQHHQMQFQQPQQQMRAEWKSQAGVVDQQTALGVKQHLVQSPTTRPSFLAMPSQPMDYNRRVDMATSPLASPRDPFGPNPQEPLRVLTPSSSSSSSLNRDTLSSQSANSRQTVKAVIVRHTPYYNTSTQTEVQSLGGQVADSHARFRIAEIQVGDKNCQTSPRKDDKFMQTRSRELKPSGIDANLEKRIPGEDIRRKNIFNFQFEGIESITAKYSTDEQVLNPMSSQQHSAFAKVPDEQASIMRKLTEEFYGNKLGNAGDKRHSSASQEHSPKFNDLSSLSMHSGTMSQAESYSSVVIHPSESSAPFGRDDFGSQSSIASSQQDLSSLQSSSRSDFRDAAFRSRRSLDPVFQKPSSRPLSESKRYSSLSSINHSREFSAPVLSRDSAQSHETLWQPQYSSSLDTKRHHLGTEKNQSSSASEISSPSIPKSSPDSRNSGSTYFFNHEDSPADSKKLTQFAPLHAQSPVFDAADSVFTDDSVSPASRERISASKPFTSFDKSSSGVGGTTTEGLNRKTSMKKAYGIYDETEKSLHAAAMSSTSGSGDSGYVSMARTRAQSDSKHLDQIQEVSEIDSSNSPDKRNQQRLFQAARGTMQDCSEDRRRSKSLRVENEKHSPSLKKTEQMSSTCNKTYRPDSATRPKRLFDGSIDSGVGSEISCRNDGSITPSESFHSVVGEITLHSDVDLKTFQQQAVINFMQRKKHQSSGGHSPDLSPYEPFKESVSDLISKTHENLAKRRPGSSFRASTSDYIDMSRQDRPKKETEWSRLRSSGSFHCSQSEQESNRSSLSSDNNYEDISVFTTPAPGGSTEGTQNSESLDRETKAGQSAEGSGVKTTMIKNNYQNFPPSRRPPPPPPQPRTPSPDAKAPPALPPRNYPRNSVDESASLTQGEPLSMKEATEVENVEAKADFKNLFNRWESNSPREDTYADQLRKQYMKLSGQRTTGAVPTSMSVIYSRLPMEISTSYKREPMIAQEATLPLGSTPPRQPASWVPMPPLPVSDYTSAACEQKNSSAVPSSSIQGPTGFSPFNTKDFHNTARVVDMKTKGDFVASSTSVQPHLPEKTCALSKGELHILRGESHPARGDSLPPRDRSLSDAQEKHQSDASPEHLSLNVSRDRSSSDSHIQNQAAVNIDLEKPHAQALSAGKHGNLQLTSATEERVLIDPADLPPPPPELVDDRKEKCPGKGGQQGEEIFAANTYGAHTFGSGSGRPVGTYSRSSSAAVIHQNSGNLKNTSDANSVVTDSRLGSQSWSSESQLSICKDVSRNVNHSGWENASLRNTTSDLSTATDSFQVQNTIKAPGGTHSSQTHLHHRPRPGSPTHLNPQTTKGHSQQSVAVQFQPIENTRSRSDDNRNIDTTSANNSASSQQPSRSVKDRIIKLERKNSFASSSSTPASPSHTSSSPSSVSQRWVNATSFEATHRSLSDTVKKVNEHTSDTQEPVTSSSQSKDFSGSVTTFPHSDNAVHPLMPSRTSGQTEISAICTDTKRGSKLEGLLPVSDFKCEPSHVQSNLSSLADQSKPAPNYYSRRESAPAPQVSLSTVQQRDTSTSRRKSDGSFLSPQQEAEKSDLLSSTVDDPVNHRRQPSQEELECDKRAQALAREVAESEKKLSDVLSTDVTRMKYMDGLFSNSLDVSLRPEEKRPRSQMSGQKTRDRDREDSQNGVSESLKKNSLPKEYFVSPLKAMLQMEWRNNEEASRDLTKNIHDNEALIKQKEELIGKLYKKLELLKEERKNLQQDISDNENLGNKILQTVEKKCTGPNEWEKFRAYIDDLEKIVRLLLNLSGQLARAENAVQGLAEDADPKLKKMTIDKRERLKVKHEEAIQLKENIDKRSDVVSGFLRQSLTAEELGDYTYFVKMKSKLTIERQELEDKITLGEEQIQELKKSIPERMPVTSPDADVSSSPPLPLS